MSNIEDKIRKLKSFLRRKAYEFGWIGRESEEAFGEKKKKWSLKSYLHQKLFDFGLVRLPPEKVNDERIWERRTNRLRRKLSECGLEEELLEQIFEDENRQWTLRTNLRVRLFSLRLTWQRLKLVCGDERKRWSPSAYLRALGLSAPRPIHAAVGVAVLSATTLAIWFGQASVAEDSIVATDIAITKRVEIKHELAELENLELGKSPNMLVVQGVVNSRKERINVLRESQYILDSQRSRLNRLELKMQSMLVSSFLDAGIETELERKELDSIAQVLRDGADPELSSLADFSLCAVAVKALSVDPTEENSKAARILLSRYQNSYVDVPSRAANLAKMLSQTRSRYSSNEFVEECVSATGSIINGSSIAENKHVARNMLEYNSFAKFNLANLEKRIRFHNNDAVEDIGGAIEQLRRQPDVLLFRWSHLIRCCEAFGSISNQKQLTESRESLSEIARTISDSNPMKQIVLRLLERQKKRISAVGTNFDIAGDENYEEVQLEAFDQKYTLVAFVNQLPRSRNLVRRLVSKKIGNEVNTIVAFEPGKLPDDPRELSQHSRHVLIASEETAKKYLDQIPIDFFPQCVLVDARGTVLATNLLPIQVSGWIAAHEKAMVDE